MYNVVFRTIVECATKGAITWTSFQSKESFDEWNTKKMKSWYKVIKEDVTADEAVKLCSSPEAQLEVTVSQLRHLGKKLAKLQL